MILSNNSDWQKQKFYGIVGTSMVSHFNLDRSLKEAKILSIDDDEWFVRLLIKKFEDVDPGFKITPAYSANEAIEILESESFDCILCDHKLPGTITVKGKIFPADGIHLMRKFIDELKLDTPVIFVTGQGSEEIASQALLQGASGYFIKRVQPG
ncbi:MAG: response regulator, partial [Candidatus Hodarchaeota archaeon]